MNRILWLVSFAVGAPCTLVAAILLFFTFSPSPSAPLPAPRVLSATAPAFPSINSTVIAADARTIVLHRYLTRYKSPLIPLAGYIVATSDEYLLDYRLLVAIAQQESNLCKRIPENSYNCWGWGIYGDKVTRFDSYEDALKRIAPQFTKIFLKGNHSKNPSEVMKTYTPPSDGSWAEGVSQFFDHLD